MEVFLASVGTLAVVLGYTLVKRLRRSNCRGTSGCLECDSPAIELHKENTSRLQEQSQKIDELYEIIKKQDPHPVDLDDPPLAQPGAKKGATI